MEIKDLLPDFLSKLFEKHPMTAVGCLILLCSYFFHFNGKEADPQNIVLYSSIGFFILLTSYDLYNNKKNSYENVEVIKKDIEYSFSEKVLKTHISRKEFQYLSIFIVEANIELFVKNEISNHVFAKRVKIFEIMKDGASACTQKLQEVLIGNNSTKATANVLRFVYDIHPGGAYILGDLNIPNKEVYIFGYTSYQKNVNLCSNKMGEIIDKIREELNLTPIAEINDNKE